MHLWLFPGMMYILDWVYWGFQIQMLDALNHWNILVRLVFMTVMIIIKTDLFLGDTKPFNHKIAKSCCTDDCVPFTTAAVSSHQDEADMRSSSWYHIAPSYISFSQQTVLTICLQLRLTINLRSNTVENPAIRNPIWGRAPHMGQFQQDGDMAISSTMSFVQCMLTYK